MDEGETVSKPDRKELRKQKLMEYLAAKGKLKPINLKPYLRDVAPVKKSSTSVVTVYTHTGKENQGPNALNVKKEGGKVQPLSGKAASQAAGVPRRSVAQKTTITNDNNKQEANKAPHTQTFTTASLTARINALKSITQSVGPRRPANQKQAPTGKKTTAVLRPHTQAASQPRAQPNQSVAVLAHPSHEQVPAKVKPQKSHLTSGTQASTLLSASTRSSTANSVRMRMAKTKTGLNPTVIQPRNTNPQASGSVPNASISTRVPRRGRSDSSSSAAICQEASVMQRKALPVRTVGQSVDGKERPSHFFRRTESRSVKARPPQPEWQRPPVTASRTAQQTTVRPNTASGKPGGRVRPNTAPGKPGGRVPPNTASGKPGGRVRPSTVPEKPGGRVQPNTAPGRPGGRVQSNTAPGRPGGRVQSNTASGRPGGRVLETRSTRPPILPAQKTKRVPHLEARVPAEAGSTASQKPARPVSTGTSNQWQATALSRAMQAAVAERVAKDSVPSADGQDAGSETAHSKAIPCMREPAAGARVPVMPQTVPRAARPASQGWWPGGVKTPVGQDRAAPQTEGKKNMTAAQEDRMRRLQEWREARGISYKRPPMPVKPRGARRTAGPPQPYWACMEQEEETQALVHAVDRSLDDCITLLLEGCPVSQVQGILSRLPAVAQKFAKFWICQARLMERDGRLDVLPMFEEAVRVVLEPVDELRAVVFDILRKKDDVQAPPLERGVEDAGTPGQGLSPSESPVDPISTPKPVRALIHGDQGNSSVVKYKITATPGGFRSQQRESARVNGHELRFFTPVRRSVRIERSSLRYPAALQDHDLCVTSYQDLVVKEEKERMGEGEDGGGDGSSPQMTPTVYVYRENDALRDQVHMQLVYEED